MKQVDKRPTEGQFVAMWEYNKDTWAHTFKYIDGELHVYEREIDEWSHSTIDVTPSPVSYFIAEPALKEITFAEDYELLKWLKDNAGEYLYSNEAKSFKAYCINTTGLGGGYRIEGHNGSHYLIQMPGYLQQKTWYHY